MAIILLPLFSFLRSLQVLRATRAANLMKVPQLTKMVRMYRLRGTAVKAIQALILLDFFQRLFGGNPERTITKLKIRLEEVEREAKDLRRKIIKLQRHQDALEAEDDEHEEDPEQDPEQDPEEDPEQDPGAVKVLAETSESR